MNSRRENNDSHIDTWSIPITLLQIVGLILAISIVIGLFAPNASNSPPEVEASSEVTQENIETNPNLDKTSEETTVHTQTEKTSSETTEYDTETSEPSVETTEQTEQTLPTDQTDPTEEFVPETEPEPTPSEPEYIGTIYLTFDDGPSTKSTSRILDILQEKGVKATFFVIDYAFESEKEQLLIREFNEGHSIGLHGTSHDYSKIYTSLEALIDNFETLQEKVYESTGHKSTIIRFPGGSSNTISKKYCSGIMTEAVNYFSTSEFVYFDWNVDSSDAGGAKSIEEVYNNVTSGLKPGRTNVVLMHDSNNKEYTIGALAAIIDFALNEGYEFKAITSDTPQVTHKVAN